MGWKGGERMTIPDNPLIRQIERIGYKHEPKVSCVCAECGEPIYCGDFVYTLNDKPICGECCEQEIDDIPPIELAERLGYNPQIAE
jgi:hypothetical protein